jgi:hypothetical protein
LNLERKHSRSKPGPDARAASHARPWRWVGGTLLLLSLLLAGALVAANRIGVAPRILSEHIQRRAEGHGRLITALAGWTTRALRQIDRANTLPRLQLPDWVGARATAAGAAGSASTLVGSADEFVAALAAAAPGQTITFLPGRYRFAGKALLAQAPGTAAGPITVRAQALGTVTLEFDLVEGFLVTAPHWRFENLMIRGVCANHDSCEHAFHVVGAAHHVTIRNNEVSDFNAHIKINGSEGRFPDSGRILANTLLDTMPRRTAAPVTPIDLVGASHWVIEGNLIADFVKAGGDGISYGAFAKGAASGTAFLRNVVICEQRLLGAPGRRVGLSFGGGGSSNGPQFCRDRRCVVEHDDGLMAGNLIMSCSDEGVYVNRSARSRLLHNTVLDTAGIDIRYPESTAQVSGNLIDGPLRVRDGAILDEGKNLSSEPWMLYLGWHGVRGLFADAGALDLRFVSEPPRTDLVLAQPDLCGRPWGNPAALGAFEDFAACRRPRVN